MFINKTFDIILNITNINEIFNKDINNTIFNLVKKKYSKKCFMGVYIEDINRILNRSLIESNQSSLNGSFNIYIQFESKCIIYCPGEIIFNMEVKDTINNIISCTNENISAIIKLNKINFELKKGQIIPIIVGKSKFITGSDTIQVNSYPFIPIIDNKKVFYKIDTLTEDVLNKLNDFITNYINVEEDIKKDILSKSNNKWDYFKNLLHPFKNNKTNDIIKTGEYIDIINITKMNNTVLYLNNEIDLSERLIGLYDINANNENNDNIIKFVTSSDGTKYTGNRTDTKNITEYIKDDDYIVIYNILKKYYLYLQAINQLSLIYDTNDKIQQNENIFNLYIKYKK